jgi:hypothetical protein
MVSMERTEAEKKAAEELYKNMGTEDGPDYPWGLCLRLGKDELTKLGVETLPEIGEEMTILAVAKVTRVSQSADKDGGDTRCVELQITEMSFIEEREDKPLSEKMYGRK